MVFLCVNGFRADARAIRYSCADRSPKGLKLALNLTSGLNLITVWSIVHQEEMKGPTGAYCPRLLSWWGGGGTPYDGLYGEAPSRKGYLFQAWSIRKGREICHLLLWKGPKRLTDGFYGFIKSRKHYIFVIDSYLKTVHLQQPPGGGTLSQAIPPTLKYMRWPCRLFTELSETSAAVCKACSIISNEIWNKRAWIFVLIRFLCCCSFVFRRHELMQWNGSFRSLGGELDKLRKLVG